MVPAGRLAGGGCAVRNPFRRATSSEPDTHHAPQGASEGIHPTRQVDDESMRQRELLDLGGIAALGAYLQATAKLGR